MVESNRKIRVLIAKPGLDGHEAGAKLVAKVLKDAGMEVIYTGARQSPHQIVSAAVQEAVNVIGLSCLSGAHNVLFPKVVELLRAEGAEEVMVIAGGIIPKDDIPYLQRKGIKFVFGPGTPLKDIVEFIKENVRSQ